MFTRQTFPHNPFYQYDSGGFSGRPQHTWGSVINQIGYPGDLAPISPTVPLSDYPFSGTLPVTLMGGGKRSPGKDRGAANERRHPARCSMQAGGASKAWSGQKDHHEIHLHVEYVFHVFQTGPLSKVGILPEIANTWNTVEYAWNTHEYVFQTRPKNGPVFRIFFFAPRIQRVRVGDEFLSYIAE